MPACHAGGREFESRPDRNKEPHQYDGAFLIMDKFYVYIIENEKGILYKGFTENIKVRLEFHNQNLSTYTAHKGPWELVFIKSFETKSKALKFEKMLKRQNHNYLNWLINSDKNEIGQV